MEIYIYIYSYYAMLSISNNISEVSYDVDLTQLYNEKNLYSNKY